MLNIDVTVYLNGYHGDCSEMAVSVCRMCSVYRMCSFLTRNLRQVVGEVDEAAKKLIQTTYDAWQAAIAICKPGVEYSSIGGVIDSIS
jgi:methionyl aminopeptidase